MSDKKLEKFDIVAMGEEGSEVMWSTLEDFQKHFNSVDQSKIAGLVIHVHMEKGLPHHTWIACPDDMLPSIAEALGDELRGAQDAFQELEKQKKH